MHHTNMHSCQKNKKIKVNNQRTWRHFSEEGRNTNGQQAYGKMLNIISHYVNSSQNHYHTPLIPALGREAEAGRSLSSRLACTRVPGQPGIQRETLFSKIKIIIIKFHKTKKLQMLARIQGN